MSNVLFSIFPNERFVDLGLYQYGWEQCEPLHSYGPYARNHYLFHYCISGTGTLISTDSKGESHTYQIKSGEGFLIYPKQINTYLRTRTIHGSTPGWNLTAYVLRKPWSWQD